MKRTLEPSIRGLALLVMVPLIGACTTTLSGSKAGPGAEGLVYYLPAPHLYLKPLADGSVEAVVEYLPDRSNAYTLRVDAYFSKATFAVTTQGGLLTTVNLHADASEVAASAIAAATDIRKSKVDEKKAQADAAEAQETAKRTAVKASAEAVATQQEKVEALELELKHRQEHPPKSGAQDLSELERNIVLEKLKLTQLEKRLGLVRAASKDTFNDPGAAKAVLPAGTAYGPVLFRMVPDGEGVKLVAVSAQVTVPPAPGSGAVDATVDGLTLLPLKTTVRKTGAQKVLLTLSRPVTSGSVKVKVMDPSKGASAPPVVELANAGATLDADKTTLTLELPAALRPGSYRLDIVATAPADGMPLSAASNLDWHLD